MTTGALRFATPDQPLSSAASKLDKVLVQPLGPAPSCSWLLYRHE